MAVSDVVVAEEQRRALAGTGAPQPVTAPHQGRWARSRFVARSLLGHWWCPRRGRSSRRRSSSSRGRISRRSGSESGRFFWAVLFYQSGEKFALWAGAGASSGPNCLIRVKTRQQAIDLIRSLRCHILSVFPPPVPPLGAGSCDSPSQNADA
jgi:hypothetical protein